MSVITLALQSVEEGTDFPKGRFPGNLRTPRHRLALYESEVTFAGIKFFNKLPLDSKQQKNNVLKENQTVPIIKKLYIEAELLETAT